MPATTNVASQLQPVLRHLLGAELPLRIRAWDGSESGPDGPAVVLRDPRALRRILWSPNEVGLARAFVAGELDIEGDLAAGLRSIRRLVEAAGTAIRSDLRGKLGVARVALGAKMQQTVQALLEAESWPGPSLVIAYSPCIAHGYDMAKGPEQQRLMVESGSWP